MSPYLASARRRKGNKAKFAAQCPPRRGVTRRAPPPRAGPAAAEVGLWPKLGHGLSDGAANKPVRATTGARGPICLARGLRATPDDMATTVPSRVRALIALVILSFVVGAPGSPAQAAPPPPADDEAEVAEAAPAGPTEAADASSDPSGDFAAAGAAVQNEGEASPDGDALDEVEAQGRASVDSRHSPGEQPELTVVPIHNAAGRPFDLAVGRHLMEGLVGVTHLTPLPATRAAIAKMHPAPKELHLPRTLTALGRRMKSSYVLVVEAIGAQHPTHVFVGLVEVKSGTTLLAYRAKMPRGVLSAELGLDLSARVRAALRHPAKLRRAAQARAEASSARPARPKVLPEPAALVPSEQTPAGEEPVEDAGEEPDAEDRADKAEKKKSKKRAKQLAEAKADEGGADEADLPRVLLDVARVWVRLPQMTQRISRLNVAAVDGASAPCYCGSPNNANPFFPMFGIGGEVYSGVLTKHRRRLQDGFGVRFDLGFAPVRSYVTGGSKATISSTVLQVEADALWRFVWLPRRTLSPDATLAVGMAYYGFPLKSAAYPGVAYIAPNFRLDLHFPVHKQVGLMAFGAVRPMMTPGGDARLRLGTPGKGTGLMLGLGVRGRWRIFDAEIRFRVESYGANFKGPTTLAGTPTGSSGTAVQFNNARLRDALKEIVLQLGVSF